MLKRHTNSLEIFLEKPKLKSTIIESKERKTLIEDEEIADRWQQYNILKRYTAIQKNLKNWKEKERLPRRTGSANSKTAELLQGLDEGTKHTLLCLINNIYKTGKIPDDFKKSVIVTVPKKTKSTILYEDITKCLDTYCNNNLYVSTTVLLHKVICRLHVSTNK